MTRSRFSAHDIAVAAAGTVLVLLRHVAPPYRELADQCRRAATSAALNLAEGAGRAGADCSHHYRIAYGSAREATTALQLLATVGAVPQTSAGEALRQLDQVQAMTWRLTHPR